MTSKFARLSILLLGLLGSGFSVAQTGSEETMVGPETTVLEIFVSRNCPACPKAYKNLAELEDDGADFLQLTWSVDYWDYLGDADPLAIEASSVRQKQYAERMGLRGPYTPQTVLNGRDQTSGARKSAVRRRLSRMDRVEMASMLTMSVEDGMLRLDGPPMPTSEVHLLAVTSLEAKGQWLKNAVISADKIADWDGGPLETAVDCAERCVVLVQGEEAGPIYNAIEFGESRADALPNH